MSNFERVIKLYNTQKKPKDSKEVIKIQKELIKKRQEEFEKKKEIERIQNEKLEKRRQKDRDYYAKNREKILQRIKNYYQTKLKDDPIFNEKKKKYRTENKEKINKKRLETDLEKKKKGIKRVRPEGYCKEYYQRNKEKKKINYQRNKEKIKVNNSEKHKQYRIKWYYQNRRNICERARKQYALKKVIKKIILKTNFIHLKKCLSVIKECQLLQ